MITNKIKSVILLRYIFNNNWEKIEQTIEI